MERSFSGPYAEAMLDLGGTQGTPVADEERPSILVDDASRGAPTAAQPPGNAVGQDYPIPRAFTTGQEFIWDEDLPAAERYRELGRRLAAVGDIYRRSRYAGGLLHCPPQANVMPRVIEAGRDLAPLIVDRVRVRVVKSGNTKGTSIPVSQLTTMLRSEAFLQEFRPLDEVVRVATYLPTFELTQPGYNDGGPGQRYLYVGPPAPVGDSLDAVNAFLKVMAFATPADRTNAVALALTVQLRHRWPGAKPVGIITSTKSHGGKETIIQFAAGGTSKVSVDYQAADWAFRQGLVAALRACPEAGLVNVENARLGRGDKFIASATLERFLTDPEPVLHSSKVRDALTIRNNLVMTISTNFGSVSEDLMNRGVPVHLNPVGDVANRESPIGNPKHEYLPANRERIEAELRGMIERWKEAGRPLDTSVKHAFTEWAQTVGGILRVNGFSDFLSNYGQRRTADDPLRRGLGLLGAARPGEWLTATDWAQLVVQLGLMKAVVPEADQDSDAGRARGAGVVLAAHEGETFHARTEDEVLTVCLHRARKRFEPGKPSTRYRFEVLAREELPVDGEA